MVENMLRWLPPIAVSAYEYWESNEAIQFIQQIGTISCHQNYQQT